LPCFVLLLISICLPLSAQHQRIALTGKQPFATPAGNALRAFENLLSARGIAFRWIAARDKADQDELVLEFALAASGGPESFSIKKTTAQKARSVRVSGGDSTGLAYGVFELAGQLESAPSADLFTAASDTSRTPAVQVRAVSISPYNRDLERSWFFSRDFWNSYFELLSRSRFNQFTLVFGHQTSYFAPPFPFMLNVPGFERVKTPEYTDDDRRKNLEALRMISELAEEWGVRFILGIWQQHAHTYGKNLVEGLSYEDLFEYCPKALSLLLKACPRIKGVQFRMNSESGIKEDDQNRFFTGMAKAVQSVGRPMWVDYRAKGLRAETIASTQAIGLRTTVSSKYWREHMGLPYHGTRIDALDKQRSYRRYGYWDLLYHDRPYDVFYRMWTFGSQKILLWGGLEYARQFALSTHLGDAKGFEVFAPLSQKGFGNWRGGDWHLFADREREYYRWEFERYWAFYMTFGLAGYAAEPSQTILDGEFRKRFGKDAPALRASYEAASWVIPFLTAVRSPAASNFRYWPEMDTDGLTDRYIALPTGDDNRFYRIDEYVADSLARRYTAKMTPAEMASRLDGWAATITESMKGVEPLPGGSGKELASTRIDFGVLAELARYHAERIRSAQEYRFFALTGDRQHLLDCIKHYRAAVARWAAIAKLTEGVYYDHMVFNRPPEQIGHWKDELPFLEVDLKRLEEIDRVFLLNSEHPEISEKWKREPRQKMTLRWKEEQGVLKRWADTTLAPDDSTEDLPDRYSMESPQSTIRNLFSSLRYTKILHVPVRHTKPESQIEIHASLLGLRKDVRLQLFYRVAGRGFEFTPVNMSEREKNVYSASIPAGKSGDRLLYYIKASDETDFFHGSAKEPHAIAVRASSGSKPDIVHSDILKARVGTSVRVEAKVGTAGKHVAVRLHYRHLDQSEDWNIVDMKSCGDSLYEATIPGDFIVPNWDIMYAIEAIDSAGAGRFYPDLDVRQPFVVTRVQP
jgi:hypothetical protein